MFFKTHWIVYEYKVKYLNENIKSTVILIVTIKKLCSANNAIKLFLLSKVLTNIYYTRVHSHPARAFRAATFQVHYLVSEV